MSVLDNLRDKQRLSLLELLSEPQVPKSSDNKPLSPVQPQLGDDVLGQMCLDPLVPPDLALGSLQQLIKLLGIKLQTLEQSGQSEASVK